MNLTIYCKQTKKIKKIMNMKSKLKCIICNIYCDRAKQTQKNRPEVFCPSLLYNLLYIHGLSTHFLLGPRYLLKNSKLIRVCINTYVGIRLGYMFQSQLIYHCKMYNMSGWVYYYSVTCTRGRNVGVRTPNGFLFYVYH